MTKAGFTTIIAVFATCIASLLLVGCGSKAASHQSAAKVATISKRHQVVAHETSEDSSAKDKSKDKKDAKAGTDITEPAKTKERDRTKAKSNHEASHLDHQAKAVATNSGGKADMIARTSSGYTTAGGTATTPSPHNTVGDGSSPKRTVTSAPVKAAASKQTTATSVPTKTPAVASSAGRAETSVTKAPTSSPTIVTTTKPVAKPTSVYAVERVGSGGLFKTFAAARSAEVAAVMASDSYDAGHVFSVNMSDGSMEWSWEPTTLGD